MRAWPRLSRAEAAFTLAGLALCAGLVTAAALLAALVLRMQAAGGGQCYRIGPPLTLAEGALLAGPAWDCLAERCWAVVRVGAEHGLACFFSR